MSKSPYLLKEARFGFRMGDGKAIDAMINDGLTNPFSGKHMAQEASEVGRRAGDDAGRHGPLGAALAPARGQGDRRGPPARGDRPGDDQGPKGDTVVEIDEAPRRDTSLESLAKLPPIFLKDGSHTAGNSPGVNDGGGALVVSSDEWAKANGKRALATIVAQAQVADDFAYLARTPANAAQKALDKAGLSAQDIDLWEINEAFASVTLNSIRMLGIDEDKVNVNGGAVALGHPIGASGARILGTLVLRAAAPRRRPRLRRDLLRRRAGRRRDRRGQWRLIGRPGRLL